MVLAILLHGLWFGCMGSFLASGPGWEIDSIGSLRLLFFLLLVMVWQMVVIRWFVKNRKKFGRRAPKLDHSDQRVITPS
jgi:hypothetical protein